MTDRTIPKSRLGTQTNETLTSAREANLLLRRLSS